MRNGCTHSVLTTAIRRPELDFKTHLLETLSDKKSSHPAKRWASTESNRASQTRKLRNTGARERLRRCEPALLSHYACAQKTAIPTAGRAALLPRSEPGGRRGDVGHRWRSFARTAFVRLRARDLPLVRRRPAAHVVVAQPPHGPGPRASSRFAQHEEGATQRPVHGDSRPRLPRGDARMRTRTRARHLDLAGNGRRLLRLARARACAQRGGLAGRALGRRFVRCTTRRAIRRREYVPPRAR